MHSDKTIVGDTYSEKNPASIAASGKSRKRGNAHGDNMAAYEKCDVVLLGK
jgi:hypothetical protein